MVTSEVGVLCTRVRLEEKRLIAALSEIGVVGLPLPPTDSPLPIQPLAGIPVGGERSTPSAQIVIDRLMDRTTASVLSAYWRVGGCTVIDAGAAASLDRLAIARLLADAGLPRPEIALVHSEQSGLHAVEIFNGMATLLPLGSGTAEISLVDREIAEAVLEHRNVLGQGSDSLALVQQGIVTAGNRSIVTVVDGVAIANEGSIAGTSVDRIAALASETAQTLRAHLIGVTIALIEGELVVWDVDSVPQFRSSKPIGAKSVEAAVAELVNRTANAGTPLLADAPTTSLLRSGVTSNVVLSA
jgi:glutathione synthase/RimK-type ligase-like ATP-grasp enzyme